MRNPKSRQVVPGVESTTTIVAVEEEEEEEEEEEREKKKIIKRNFLVCIRVIKKYQKHYLIKLNNNY